VLFIFAENDPQRTRAGVNASAATLAGVAEVVPGQTYGDLARGTAVRMVEVPGENHLSIVSSEPAAREIIGWLDGIFGTARTEQPDIGDPRLRTAELALVAFLLLLVPIGQVCGRLAPMLPERPAEGGVRGLLALTAALLASMAFLTTATPAVFLSLQVYDVIVSHLLLAGVFLLAGLALRGDLAELRNGLRWRRSIGPAFVAFVVIYVLLAPLGVVTHRLTPTPERLGVGLLATLLLFPFFLAFELQLRRGAAGRAFVFGLMGRVMILLVTYLGVLAGVLPPVVLLMLPVLALTFLMVELLAASLYARSHDVVLVAMVESLWIAWIFAVTAPIRI
jgi:hypothetical protein